MVKHAVMLLGLASASACLSADYSAADAEPCPADEVCQEGWVCVVGYCVPSADDVPVCGDGLHQDYAGEACDDGNQIDTDACRNSCVVAACGDGVVHEGVEGCDDGNVIASDACTDACISAVCGDGVVRRDLSEGDQGYEDCDDGNTNLGDGCSDACLREGCGNGRIDMGEDCDDGNLIEGDGCSHECLSEGCGNGRIDGDDECDDGNRVAGDGCSNECLSERCGNSRVDSGEACDDGNTEETDACTDTCQRAACRDGILRADLSPGAEGYEACDDGNTSNVDACTNQCVEAVCGDGFARTDLAPEEQQYEACDDGNDDNDVCTESCRWVAGASQGGALRDCQALKALRPGLPTGVYWIDPDQGDTANAFRAHCDMQLSAGGWTQVVNLARSTSTWNAWDTEQNPDQAHDLAVTFGIPMNGLSDDANGEDLEIVFKVHEIQNGLVQRGPIYRGVNKDAWNSAAGMGDFDVNGFQYRTVGWEAWSQCDQILGRDNTKWNWSIAKPGSVTANCANYSRDAQAEWTGFLLEGTDANPDQAYALNGLNRYGFFANFAWLQIYVRRGAP